MGKAESLTKDEAKAALLRLANNITNGWDGDATLAQQWGWELPPLNRHELAKIPTSIARRISHISDNRLSSDSISAIGQIPAKVEYLQSSVIQQIYNGNGRAAIDSIRALADWIYAAVPELLSPVVDWQSVDEEKLVPTNLKRRIRGIEATIKLLEDRSVGLGEKIDLIDDAHAAAESLPTDLQSLQDASQEVGGYLTDSRENAAHVQKFHEDSRLIFKELKAYRDDVVKLVENCEDAYSAATTKGLGEAFAGRASELKSNVYLWVSGLVIALAAGVFVGNNRVNALSASINNPNISGAVVISNLLLAVIGIGAPVWFAWLATKQIGHGFRLAEDYAFKATVARAYEGYRREAVRLDEAFAKRLFSSALDRLDEAPLRFVELESHGSPGEAATDGVLSRLFPKKRSGELSSDGLVVTPPIARQSSVKNPIVDDEAD